MKKIIYCLLIFSLILFTAFEVQKTKKKVLIIGDSISIGYTPFVKNKLSDVADVFHNRGNAQDTGKGKKMLSSWLGETKWDVIVFYFGLWDLR